MTDPMTPRSRRRLAETREKPYVPFNPKPKDVGTKTGLPMPKNVPKTADGFEDPDIFFNTPAPSRRNQSMGGMTSTTTPGTTPGFGSSTTTRTRGRMSGLTVDDLDDDENMADSLLGDDGDLLGDQLSTPHRGNSGPYFPNSNPPPSVSQPRRSQLPPPSPNIEFDAIPSPQRTATRKRQSAGAALAAALNINEPSGSYSQDDPTGADDTLDDLSPTQMNSDDDNDDDTTGVEMGRNRLSMASRKSMQKTPTKISRPVDPDEEDSDQEMVSDHGAGVVRQRAQSAVGSVGDELGNDYGGDLGGDFGGDYGGGDYGGGEDDGDDNGDDVGLEEAGLDEDEQAHDDEGRDEDDEEEEEEQVEEQRLPNKKRSMNKGKGNERQGSKPPAAAKSKSKTKRRSLHHTLPLGPGGETALTGDFTVRRTGRQHFKPLEYWRGERFEYEKGQVVPLIKGVVRAPEEFVEPLAARNKRYHHPGRGRSQSRPMQERERGGSHVPSEEGLDDDISTAGLVLEYETKNETKRRIALPKRLIDPKMVPDEGFKYQKVFGEGRFIAAGYVHIPVGEKKPGKNSKDNAYIFHVIKGAVTVKIHKTQFVMAPGGMFLVPRGNMYSIENCSNKEAELFFAQSRKMRVGEEDPETTAAALVKSQSQSQSQISSNRVNGNGNGNGDGQDGDGDGEEGEEEEEEEEEEEIPVLKKKKKTVGRRK